MKRLKIIETNYGRDSGWIIERNGSPIGVLTNCKNQDMFWDSYEFEIVTNDIELRQRMTSAEFWNTAEAEKLIYRNKVFGDIVAHAFPAMSPIPEPGRLLMRGLYLSIGSPSPWERVILWLRSSIRSVL